MFFIILDKLNVCDTRGSIMQSPCNNSTLFLDRPQFSNQTFYLINSF